MRNKKDEPQQQMRRQSSRKLPAFKHSSVSFRSLKNNPDDDKSPEDMSPMKFAEEF